MKQRICDKLAITRAVSRSLLYHLHSLSNYRTVSASPFSLAWSYLQLVSDERSMKAFIALLVVRLPAAFLVDSRYAVRFRLSFSFFLLGGFLVPGKGNHGDISRCSASGTVVFCLFMTRAFFYAWKTIRKSQTILIFFFQFINVPRNANVMQIMPHVSISDYLQLKIHCHVGCLIGGASTKSTSGRPRFSPC